MPKADKKVKRERKPVAPEVRKRYDDQRLLAEAQDAERNSGPAARTAVQFGSKKSPILLEAFLTWLRKGYSAKFAADKCNVRRETFFDWRDKDEAFKAAWKKAIDEGTDYMEDEARRRAVDGVDRPTFQMGECVGFTREYSDSLLAMQLKGRRPERYGDKVAHTGAEGGAIRHHIEVEFVKPGGKE